MSDVLSGSAAPRAATSTNTHGDTLSFPVIAGLVRLADLVLLGMAGVASVGIVTWLYGAYPEGPIQLAETAGTLATALGLAREGAYAQTAMQSISTQLRLLIKPLLLGTFCLVAGLFVLYQGQLPVRIWPLIWAICAGGAIGLGRIPLWYIMRYWTAAGRLARKIAIVGLSDFSHEFIERLRDEPSAFNIVGIYDDRIARVPPSQLGIDVLGTVAELVERSRRERIDVIVVALPLKAVERIKAIMDQLASTVADIVLTTDLAGLRYARTQFHGIGRNAVVSVREAPLKDWRLLEKTLLDYTIGVAALLILSPVLLLTAVLIKLESPGPVLFRQPRMGFNNQLFLCYKFRSMHHDMRDMLADKQTTRDDPRITRVGRIIRKLSVDELPQLLNVLNGTMSLVGPRPHAPNTKAADRLFTEVVQQYAVRHRVKPGITGWAQVNGWRGETTTVEQIEQRVACDLFYIENWSIALDLKIMVMTVLREVRSRNAF
ncbi:undecaprenyl-phosphate glucose phosphotransferase [Acidisphaera sp. L21]|jgi:Undecaprenyl-phosphate glucose phosphotransferase|uniref:undecaprenyl-phosphate glucose phosphotransferase n=1 Tax=Acidisphaera sp. L21 TaxID=1641851 RepID=UPI00131B4FF7|nr:undecaprenyl-phosphate glucose phosphotransferase [Acidisphaera sp. L21]